MADVATMLAQLEGAPDTVRRPDGTELAAIDAAPAPGSGTAAPVLLVHGYGVTAGEWSLVQPALRERGHRVIAYDHRAHGRSTLGRDGCTSNALFTDLVGVIDHFDLGDAIVVGHSMGTFTSLGAAADPGFRRRVRGIVLVSAETGHMLKGALAARLLAPLSYFGVLERICRASPVLGRAAIAPAVGPEASFEVREATRVALGDAPAAVRAFLPVMNRDTLEPLLPALELPIRLICGDADKVTPIWHSELVAERAPDATLIRLPRIGHMVNWEAPDAILEVIAGLS
jgi:pimeloyl-ACP methyl ester carboxylesterase